MRSEVKTILSVGRWLMDEVGVAEWALTREQAVEALSRLSQQKVAVLGGDVYLIDGERVRVGYANWSCSPLPEENASDFIDRSIDTAQSYVERFVSPSGQPLFTLITASPISDGYFQSA